MDAQRSTAAVRKRSGAVMARCLSGTERSLPADRRETLRSSTDVRPTVNEAGESAETPMRPSGQPNVKETK